MPFFVKLSKILISALQKTFQNKLDVKPYETSYTASAMLLY